jgi:phosphoribosylaminoimidazole carboxylase (NCAIR synthetase)
MKKITSPLPPGSTVGILGGGQLARMLALAAGRLGLDCHIYAPEADSPAFAVSAARRRARPPRHDCHASKEAIFTVEFARAAPCPCGYMRRKYRDHHSS